MRGKPGRTQVRVLVVVSLAVLAFVAALAGAFDWGSSWVAIVVAVGAVLGLIWRLYTDVVVPYLNEVDLRRTVQVRLSADGDTVSVGVMNAGTHEVRNVEILTMPVGADRQGIVGAPFEPTDHTPGSGVTFYPSPDRELWFEIEELIPGKGWGLGAYHDIWSAPAEKKFELSWTDPQGRRRRAVGVADLRDGSSYPYGSVILKPREEG